MRSPYATFVEDGFWKWIRLLEHHPHTPPHEHGIDVRAVDRFSVELDVTGRDHAFDRVVHPIEASKERALCRSRSVR